jgi:GT2 family glycosyltransferase
MSVMVEAGRDGNALWRARPEVPSVSVVICTNRPAGLAAAVGSVLANEEPPFELVVVAQGGPDASWAHAELASLPDEVRHDPRLRIVHDPRRGLSHARNIGVRETSGDLILFTDDDCVVAPDWVAAHVACYQECPEAMLLYGKVVPPATYTGTEGFVPTFEPTPVRDPARLSGGLIQGMGANMSCRRTLLERIGPFDEVLGAGGPLMSAEDLDLSLRAFSAKQVILADSRPVVVHEGGVRSRGQESWQLWQRDGVGLGAAVAKGVRSGQWRAAAAPINVLLGLWRDAAQKVVNGRRPFGLAMIGLLTIGSLDGFRRGMRQPMTRSASRCVYVAER